MTTSLLGLKIDLKMKSHLKLKFSIQQLVFNLFLNDFNKYVEKNMKELLLLGIFISNSKQWYLCDIH